MALSMFGYWEIRMPTALMNRAGARSGVAGAFGMGLFVGVVAAPCVGGFIVGLLAFVAARQDPGLGLLIFFVLSLGLGLPYLFLGAFSGSLSRLPRAGAWMESVKKVFGWILLAMAAYFLRSVLPRPFGHWLLPVVLGIALVAVLVRGYGLRWPLRAGVAALFLAIAIFFVPRTLSGWQPYPAGAAASTGRPAVIDFSADWCLPCLELEKRTFSDARVREGPLGRRPLQGRHDAARLARVGRARAEVRDPRRADGDLPRRLRAGAHGPSPGRVRGRRRLPEAIQRTQ